MQKALFFMKVLRCTAGEDYTTHKGTYALDFGGHDGGKDLIYAPFDLKIKKINKAANTVFFESLEKVETPTFTDYVCGRFAHCNDADMLPNCYVGAVIKQGEAFYREGGKGNGVNGKFGTHVHAVFARGHLTGAYWYDVGNGNYGMLSTGGKQHMYDVLFVPDDVQIVKTNDYKDKYNWRRVAKKEDPSMIYIDGVAVYLTMEDETHQLTALQNEGDPTIPKTIASVKDVFGSEFGKVSAITGGPYFINKPALASYGQLLGRLVGLNVDRTPQQKEWMDVAIGKDGIAHVGDFESWEWKEEYSRFGFSPAMMLISGGVYSNEFSSGAAQFSDSYEDAFIFVVQDWSNNLGLGITNGKVKVGSLRSYFMDQQMQYLWLCDGGGSAVGFVGDTKIDPYRQNRKLPAYFAIIEKKEEIKMVDKTISVARCTKGTVGDKYCTRDNVMGTLQPNSLWLEKGKEYPLLAVTEKPAQDGYTWAMVRIGNIIVYVQADPDYIQLIDPEPQPKELYEPITEVLYRKKA